MPKMIYTRSEIESLAERLTYRANSIVLADMPKLCMDMRVTALLLKYMLDNGMPVTSAELEVDHNGNNGH